MNFDKIDYYKNVLFAILLFAMAVWLLLVSGCSTEKKAQKQVNSAIVKHPKIALNSLRNAFPCIVTNSDTLITLVDSIVYIECPEVNTFGPVMPDNMLRIEDMTNEYFGDSAIHSKVIKSPAKTIRVPVTLPVKTITIVKEIEDLAQIRLKDIELTEMKADRDKWQAKSKSQSKTNKWLILLLVGALVPYIIKAIRFFTI